MSSGRWPNRSDVSCREPRGAIPPPSLTATKSARADGGGREYHIAVIGTGGVGKSCLTGTYACAFDDPRETC